MTKDFSQAPGKNGSTLRWMDGVAYVTLDRAKELVAERDRYKAALEDIVRSGRVWAGPIGGPLEPMHPSTSSSSPYAIALNALNGSSTSDEQDPALD